MKAYVKFSELPPRALELYREIFEDESSPCAKFGSMRDWRAHEVLEFLGILYEYGMEFGKFASELDKMEDLLDIIQKAIEQE